MGTCPSGQTVMICKFCCKYTILFENRIFILPILFLNTRLLMLADTFANMAFQTCQMLITFFEKNQAMRKEISE